jgi:hypothetical protein
VLALTLAAIDDDDRRLLRRLAGLVADMIVTKDSYTDQFFEARRSQPMSLAAEVQWALLPPLTIYRPGPRRCGQGYAESLDVISW